MRGGRLVARMLSAFESPVFALCGDHITAILEGCAEEGVRIVDTRDERAAASMAQGWSLATATPGICLVTGGPGLAAAMGPIADASMAGVPLLVVTSRIRAREEGRGFPQDVESAAIAGGMAPVRIVRSADQIARVVAAAHREAVATRGPVVLEISLDAQLAPAPDDAPAPATAEQLAPGYAAIEAAARALRGAERPVAILGDGCFWSGGAAAALRLIEASGMPAFTVRAARGLVPDDHPFCLGQPNILHAGVRAIFDDADVLMVAGGDLDITLGFGGVAPKASLIRIDAAEHRLTQNRTPEVAVLGDEARVLTSIAQQPLGNRDAWAGRARAMRDDPPPFKPPDEAPVHPAALVQAVASCVTGPATFTIDAGALALWALEGLPARGPGRLLTSFGTKSSTIGGGLPFAIAARIARPDEPAIAVVGDGALGYQAMELDTAARLGIDVVVIVGNDASWGIVRQQMESSLGRSVAAELAHRRYDELARSLGAHGERIDDSRLLRPALEAGLRRGGPVLIDVTIDRDVRHEAMTFIAGLFAPDE